MSGTFKINGNAVFTHDNVNDVITLTNVSQVDDSVRGAVTTVTLDSAEYKVNLSDTNNFSITTSGNGTLQFYNTVSGSTTTTINSAVVGQSGNVYFNNASSHVISAGTTVYISGADLNRLSVTGEYWMSYYVASTTKILVTLSEALT
jgi:hypothetical protein